ncbi:Sugar transporter, conserved site,Major facilitator superfamily domain,Major facilitator, sugar [Cinara cedri]|uniref:Sugar transporter, conserved site,Major facilitator superfamily domain,Major facilitator, sugar n=1 Tax=Cinara cedri TaxID=506608 RepID=A0A5E4N7K9_9HEMI|nr:Sugar transporter, conserved site,Major facilitator superfamily domain,Major facilitator, sugar [Cinara cedri]
MKEDSVDFGYGIKSTLAQCLLLTTTYFLNVQQGIDMMMPTVIIGAMNKSRYANITDGIDVNVDDTIPSITDEQLSWIGSLVYLTPPLGSLFLSLVQSNMGHRVCMALTNLIQFMSVVVVVMFPVTVNALYVCSMLMGLSTGFATGLCISYSGEVCDPKVRSSLTSALNVFYFGGYFFITTLYAITTQWKKTLLITVAVPLINFVALSLTPDSPMWLLSKGKTDKARKTLCKLRGWETEEKCAKEFEEMVEYVSSSTTTEEPKKKTNSWISFSHPGLWKPLKFMMIYIFFSNIMSGVPFTPYLVDIFRTYSSTVDAEWATSAYMAFSMIGNIFTVLLVQRLGKRCLVQLTIAICSLCYLCIGSMDFFVVNNEYTSCAILSLFFLSAFSSSLGIMPIGWVLMSEVFPMKSKNMGCSIGSGVYFFMSFFMTKFYLDLRYWIGFNYTFVLFGALGFSSLVYFYFFLPDTDNKTLKEINEQIQLKKLKKIKTVT